MTIKSKVIVGLIAAVGLLALGFTVARVGQNVGAAAVNSYQAGVWWFGSGFYAGSDQQFSIDSSGTASSSASATIHNGVTDTYKRTALTTSTTTVCAIQSPAATTTLVYGAASFTVSSTTASFVTLAKAATAFATTTTLGKQNIAANEPATIIASTSPATVNANVFGPSQWFVVGMQNGEGSFSPAGACTAVFRSTI